MQISTRRSRAMRWPRKCGRGSKTRNTKYRASSSRRARASSSGWRTTGRSPGRCRHRWAATSMTCSSIPPVGVAAQPTCSCGSWLALPERTAGHWSAGSRRTTTIAAAASTTSTPRAPCGSPTTCRRPPPRPHRACDLLIVAKPGNGGGDDQDDVGWCMPKAPRSNGSASSPSRREWAAQGYSEAFGTVDEVRSLDSGPALDDLFQGIWLRRAVIKLRARVPRLGVGTQRRTSEVLVDADLDTLATALYVRTDDLLKASPHRAPARPRVGITPTISDAELVTLAVMQALAGRPSEARWLRYARAELRHLFPYLPQQPAYNKRLRRLGDTFAWLIAVLARDTSLFTDDVWWS